MAETPEKLADFVSTMVTPMVTSPDDVSVDAAVDGNRVTIEVHVASEDVGKVIGRGGRVIKSIRTLTRAAATKMSESVDVELVD